MALREDKATVVLCCLRTVFVFEAELAVRLKEWDQLPVVIEVSYVIDYPSPQLIVIVQSVAGLPTDLVNTLEAIADILVCSIPFLVSHDVLLNG